MVKLIIGGTGSGKTKELIDQVNAAVKEEKGSVVCISRGNKLTFDISHDARLIDAADYPVSDIAGLLGFVGGLHAGNYDITRVFIDGLYKIIGGKDAAKAEEFLVALDAFFFQAQRKLHRFAQRGAGVCYRRHEAFPVILKRKYISQAQKSNDESRCFFLLPAAGLVRKKQWEMLRLFPFVIKKTIWHFTYT